jgi:hypothetical protein
MDRIGEEVGHSPAARLGGFGLLTPALRPAQSWSITTAFTR